MKLANGVWAAAAAALLLSSGSARAEPEHKHKHHHPCHADREKFCKDIKPGKDGTHPIHDCLNENKDKLDKKCAKALAKWDDKHEAGAGGAAEATEAATTTPEAGK